MGTTAYGDLPSGALVGAQISHASVASDGAAASYNNIGANTWRAPQNGRVESIWWEPTGADNSAASAVSFRTLTIRNGSSDGTGTAVLGSLVLSASLASNTTRAFTLAATPTFSAGQVVYAAQAATGTNATHTVLVAGRFHVNWRPI